MQQSNPNLLMNVRFGDFHGGAIITDLFKNLPAMAYRLRNDPEWTMVFVSEGCSGLTGYSSQDLLQSKKISYLNLIHEEDRYPTWFNIQAAIKEHKPYELDYRIRTQDGQEKWVRDLGSGVFDADGNLIAIEGFASDITARIQYESRIEFQNKCLQAFHEINQVVGSSFDLRLTIGIILEKTISCLNVDAADLLVYKSTTNTLDYYGNRGFHTNALQFTHLRLGEGYAGRAALNRQAIYIPNLSQSPGPLTRSGRLSEEGFTSYYGVPLIAKGQIKGVLEIFHRSRLSLEPDWVELLETLAYQATIAIDYAALFDELQRSNFKITGPIDPILETWALTLDYRNYGSRGNIQQVVQITSQVAKTIGLTEPFIEQMRWGALLHDIGTLEIPEAIMKKQGPLTPEEWDVIHQHPQAGYKLLKPIYYLQQALDIPLYHQEKFDGSGYPFALSGNKIPLAARIFSVVDVWNAMTTPRPYRTAWSSEKTLDYIQSQAGKHFDPEVVQSFLSCKSDFIV